MQDNRGQCGSSLGGVTTVCSSLSPVQLFVAPWTVAHQAPLSIGLSQQEYWSGLPFPPLRDLSDPGIKPMSPEAPALAGGFFTTEPLGKPFHQVDVVKEHMQFGSQCPDPGLALVRSVIWVRQMPDEDQHKETHGCRLFSLVLA